MLRRSKDSVKKAAVHSRLLRAAERLIRPAAVILMYHSIVEDPRETAKTIGGSQSRSAFEAHMRTLAERFSPVTIEQIEQFVREGRRLPARPVATTFDDGFADNCEVALPVLARYGIPAAFYVLVNAVETGVPPWYCRLNHAFSTTTKPEWTDLESVQSYRLGTAEGQNAAFTSACDAGARKTGSAQEEFVRQVEKTLDVEPLGPGLMLSWDEVRALQRAGHIVGAHTLSHPNLAHVSQEEARSEIVGSRQRLEQATCGPIYHFSYPHPALNPQWNLQTLQITREAGFRSAVLTTRGPVRPGDEPLALKRIYAADDLDQWIWNLECTFLGRSI